MKNFFLLLIIITLIIPMSCGGENTQKEDNENTLEIQGEETGGMGTGPGPGVEVPLDTAENISPDTVIVD